MVKEKDNKRDVPRYRIRFPIKYTIVGGEQMLEHNAVALDVSIRSLAFEATEVMAFATVIEAELLISSLPKSIKVKGKVNRIEEVARKKYLHSIMFEEINKEDEDALGRYVQLFSDIGYILRLAVEKDATSLHLLTNSPPVFRIEGELLNLDLPAIAADDLKRMIFGMLTEKQYENFAEKLELDFSYFIPEGVRFRVNIFQAKGQLSAVFRVIKNIIRTPEELGLASIVADISRKKGGLVIVSGPVDSGKSTTLATIIDAINKERRSLIISIEDPIEYVHSNIKGFIFQREIGTDTLSFSSALKHVLRQDADVIFVGEMRDRESITMTISAAETGQLVLTTLHTPDTVECISRIIDVYPAAQQEQVRVQLASCIECVIGQNLLPRADGNGRILATEVVVATPAIRHLIRAGHTEQIRGYLESGAEFGMNTMDKSLVHLVQTGMITKETAELYIRDRKHISYL